MTTINLAPDARGIENIARTFREGIQQTQDKIKRLEETQMLIDTEERERLSIDVLGSNEAVDEISDALDLLIDQEEKRITSLTESLAECELAIEGNNLIREMGELAGMVSEHGRGVIESTIELIRKLAEKAGMKG